MTEPRRRVLVAAGNSGLGLGLLDRLFDDGTYDLLATYRKAPNGLIEKFVAHWLDPECNVFQADLTNYDDVQAAVSHAATNGPLWGIVNLAGTASAQRLAKMDPADIRTVLLDGCLSAMYLTKAGIGAFESNGLGGGRLIHSSSVTVRRVVPGVAAYNAAKAGIEGLVRAAAEELGRSDSTINALRLGYFDAGMSALVPPAILDRVIEGTASHRLGSSYDLASAVRHLLSPDAAFINGAVLELDGGLM